MNDPFTYHPKKSLIFIIYTPFIVFLYVIQFYIYSMYPTNIYSVPTESLGTALDARNKRKHIWP